MIIGFGLIPSIIIFILELIPRFNKKRSQADPLHGTKPLKQFGTTNVHATVIEVVVNTSDTTTEVQKPVGKYQ